MSIKKVLTLGAAGSIGRGTKWTTVQNDPRNAGLSHKSIYVTSGEPH